jgi:hypothetical protein
MRNYFFLLALLISTYCIRAVVPCFTPVNGENLWRMISRFQVCFSDLEAGIESILEVINACDICSCVDVTVNSLGDVLTDKISLVDSHLLSVSDELQMLIISDGDAVCSCLDTTVHSVGDVLTNKISLIDPQLLSISDLLQMVVISAGDAVCSCVDVTVNSVGDVIISKTSPTDPQLFSISDLLQAVVISVGDAVCSCIDVTVNSVSDVITSEIEEIKSCLIGTAITNAMIPFSITQPGLYYVCETIEYTGTSPVITISDSAFDVTLDLGGHVLGSIQSRGIEIDGAFDVVVKNGIIDPNPTGAGTGLEAIAVIGAEGVYISDISVKYGPDVSFLINNAVEVTIDRCHFDNNAGNTVGQPNAGTLLINGTSRAVIVRDCDVYNPLNAGYSVDVTVPIIAPNTKNAEIRFERCSVCSDLSTLPLYGFYLNGVQGASIVTKDCSAQLTQTGFYNTTITVDSTGEPLVLDSCIATLCNNGFAILGGTAGTDIIPTSKVLLDCVSSNNSINGFMVENALAILFQNCSAQQNGGSGFLILSTTTETNQLEFEECVSSFNGADGFTLSGSHIAETGFRFCTASANTNIGFNCDTTSFVVIKDCLALHNALMGISMQLGTVFDTRSGTSADNLDVDSLGAGHAINYSMVSS